MSDINFRSLVHVIRLDKNDKSSFSQDDTKGIAEAIVTDNLKRLARIEKTSSKDKNKGEG